MDSFFNSAVEHRFHHQKRERRTPMLERLWNKMDLLLATGAVTFPVWGPFLTQLLQLLLGLGGLVYLAVRFYVLKLVYNKVKQTERFQVGDLKEGG